VQLRHRGPCIPHALRHDEGDAPGHNGTTNAGGELRSPRPPEEEDTAGRHHERQDDLETVENEVVERETQQVGDDEGSEPGAAQQCQARTVDTCEPETAPERVEKAIGGPEES
jgi:hypothetical protein